MGLNDYAVPRDKFQLEEKHINGFAFPCGECRHRHGTDSEEPCTSCDHNLNAGDADSDS